jgi:putative transposase
MPYLWRKLTPERREAWLAYRKLLKRPWHCPPHFDQGAIFYHLTGACFEHRSHIGHSESRLVTFCERLIAAFDDPPAAWCVLPNHYHVLVRCRDLKATTKVLGRFHGRLSYDWNGEEGTRGRQVWHSVSDRGMRNPDHFWATVNYIHHNPVKHGYVSKWEDWPFSSAPDFLAEMGREGALEIWRRYPILDYGKGWDD